MDLRNDGSGALRDVPGAGGEKPVSVGAAGSLDPVAWAAETFAALNMTWREAKAKPGHVRVLGNTADQQAILDVTIKGGKVVAASTVTPIRAEYTSMLVFLLAVLVEGATQQEADKWLARSLDKLRRDKPSQTTQPWHRWRVTLTTTTLGLLTMQVR